MLARGKLGLHGIKQKKKRLGLSLFELGFFFFLCSFSCRHRLFPVSLQLQLGS